MNPTGPTRRWAVWLAFATVLAYLPTLDSAFLADDYALLTKPVRLRTTQQYMRPLPHLTLALHYRWFGLAPLPAHAFQLALHLVNAWLVAVLARRLTKDPLLPLLAAGLFALHPVHPAAVSWVSARFDVMCATFLLGSLVTYDDFRERRGPLRLVASLALFVAALFSKELAVCAPLLLVAWDLARGRRPSPMPIALVGLLLAAYVVLRQQVIGSLSAKFDAAAVLGGFVTTTLSGLHTLVLPLNPDVWSPALLPLQIVTGGLLAALVVAGRLRGIDRRILGLGLAVFLITILPTAGFTRSLGAAIATGRWLYVPSAGFALAVATLAVGRVGRGESSSPAVRITAAATLFLFTALTFGNNLAWRGAGRITDRVTEGLVELFPTFGTPRPVVLVRGAPRTHQGVYVFLNMSLEHAVRLSHPESPRAVVVRGALGKRFDRMGWTGEPERLFAVRWDPEAQALVDETSEARATLAAYLARNENAVRWSGDALAEWSLTGARADVSDGAFLLDLDQRQAVLISPELPPSRALALKLSSDGAKPTVVRVSFADAPDGPDLEKPITLRIARTPAPLRHLAHVPKDARAVGAPLFARIRALGAGNTLRVHEVEVLGAE